MIMVLFVPSWAESWVRTVGSCVVKYCNRFRLLMDEAFFWSILLSMLLLADRDGSIGKCAVAYYYFSRNLLQLRDAVAGYYY